MKVFSTRSVLIFGIQELEVEQGPHPGTVFYSIPYADPSLQLLGGEQTRYFLYEGEWHKTKGEAIIEATRIRDVKIREYEGRIAELKTMTFS